MISDEKLTYFKKRLLHDKEELEKQIAGFETPPDFGDEPGPEDEIDEAQELHNNLSIAASLRDKLANIESAIERMDKGTYGVCEATGKEIPLDVLEVNPEARFHPEYMKRHEHGAS
jgi:RNA polymerase-binding transcription factor DksA